MTAIKQLVPSTNDLLDEEALIKEARVWEVLKNVREM